MTKQIALRLPEPLVDAVDAVVKADPRFPTRSAALQRAVVEFVERHRSASIDAAIVAGYTRTPPEASEGWGDVEDAALAASLANAARLDAEDGGW